MFIEDKSAANECLLFALLGSGVMSEVSPKDDEKQTSWIVKCALKRAQQSNPKGK
jgi:hypothetical protein